MKYFFKKQHKGFTLIEIIVVISITVILSTFVYTNIQQSRENAGVMQAGLTQKELTKATEAYFRDMGFYPPDVNRGYDPGFEQSLPWSPDGLTNPGTDTSTVPSDWQTIIAQKWSGPYMLWPKSTPWGGKYDYNYWPEANTRNGGCVVQKGIYASALGDYNNNNTIPPTAEQKMIDKGFDSDGCVNGEAQLLLWKL